VLSRLADAVFPCRHRNITLPFNNRQTCLDCGATRLFIFDTGFETATAGIFRGPWRKAKPASIWPPAPALLHNAHHPLSVGNPENVSLDGRASILNPGSESPLFQKAVRQ
jgi:hypothetical protein